VIFSAHGVAKSVPEEAARRGLNTIDATCPLVTKVHRRAMAHFKRGRLVILVGHAGHPEVVGTMGQLPPGAVLLVGTPADVARLEIPQGQALACVTQTTLSVDETRDVVEALKARFPEIHTPAVEDICYATTNRQEAVKQAARMVEAIVVVGAANSSNSQRLREVAEREGCRIAILTPDAESINWAMFEDVGSLAISAGASAPEVLVERILDGFAERFDIEVETLTTADETMFFPLPRALREATAS
jgi:4-hydroxy-3-methylbut-2-enyl diphosphate reductase